ncbi:hypothetical protein SCUP234_11327 [Seiridium cupressi]
MPLMHGNANIADKVVLPWLEGIEFEREHNDHLDPNKYDETGDNTYCWRDIMPSSPSKRSRYEDDTEGETATPRADPRPLLEPVPFRLATTTTITTQDDRPTKWSDDTFSLHQQQNQRRTNSSVYEKTPSLTSAGLSQSSRNNVSRRSRSPVKKVADLRLLNKPIEYRAMVDKDLLPDELQHLLEVIYSHEYDRAIFPHIIKDEIVACLSGRSPPPDHTFYYSGEKSTDKTRARLRRLRDIIQASLESAHWARSEPAWNLLVHWPILQEALSDIPDIEPELITTAQILPSFLPDMPDLTTTSQARLVDFALLYRPSDSSPDHDLLRNLLRSLQSSTATLNQSDYGPLRHFPAPVAIETKTASGDVEEAKVQLGVWIGAWYKRMKNLCPASATQRLFGIPLLLVDGHRWSLYVAQDSDSEIVGVIFLRLGAFYDTSLFIFAEISIYKALLSGNNR